MNSIIIEAKDNIAVALEELAPGAAGAFLTKDGIAESVEITDKIPIYHKFAVCDIAADAPVIKYGEHIGFATSNIKKGQHVHTHNVVGRRENLEINIKK